jgi:plasmid replication initiation protein|nr:replication initiation protein [uncultured Halomonas sp.]
MNKSKKDLRVYKANAVVEASYDLSVSEHRLLLACFAQIGQEATDQRLYRIHARDIAELADIPTPDAYRDAAAAAARLYERSVEVFEGPNGTTPPKKRRFRWIQEEAVYAEGEGYVDVRLSTSILPYVNNLLEQYTVYHMQDVARMTSRYAIRVYELLVQWRRRGSREVEVEWLRRTLGVGDKYPNFKDFRRWVLEQAVSQINERSPLHVEWEPRKTGRRITHIEFKFTDEREVKRLEEKSAAKPKKNKQKTADNSSGARFGISEKFIKKHMRPGEDYEDAALRLFDEAKRS